LHLSQIPVSVKDMKILIIDDDRNMTDMWTIALRNANFEILVATTAKEGIEKAKNEKPEFILLDQIMPDMKGNDVLRLMKADPDINTIPVAVVSNYSEEKMMNEAIEAGAVDYILKYQIEPQDLVEKIRVLVPSAQLN